MEECGDSLRVVEEVVEPSEAAVYREVFAACFGVFWAVEQDMLYGLDWFAACASDLVGCVVCVKASGIVPYKCVSGDYPVQCAQV